MTLEAPLGNFNVMPAQAGIHDFLAAAGSRAGRLVRPLD
jgi:hypothetical protein